MLCLQETKKEMVDRTVCQALWGDSKVKWAANPAVNGAGGTNLKMKIPSKVAHFVWRLVKNRLPTKAKVKYMLQSRIEMLNHTPGNFNHMIGGIMINVTE